MQFECTATTRSQRLSAPFDFAAEHIEPVGAPFEGERRLEGSYLLGNLRHHRGGNVRRIGNDQMELANRRFGNARRKVAFDDAHAVGKTERRRVLARKCNGIRRDIGGDNAGIGALVGNRASDATAPRAQVGHEKRLGSSGVRCGPAVGSKEIFSAERACYLGKRIRILARFLVGRLCSAHEIAFPSADARVARHAAPSGGQKRKRLTHEDLSFGARNEHARAHLHRDMAERNLARDVLQRLASPAARHVTAKNIALFHREGPLEIDVELHATQARSLGKKPLRRQARILVALARKIPLRPLERSLNSPHVIRHRNAASLTISPVGAVNQRDGP